MAILLAVSRQFNRLPLRDDDLEPMTTTESPATASLGDTKGLFARFGVDTRALAVARVGLAAIIVIEWLTKASGYFPISLDLVSLSHFVRFPAAMLLMVGHRTRVVSVVTWLAYALPLRELLLSGSAINMGHYCTALLLFWLMFLPVGEHLSWDANGSKGAPPRTVLSVASAGLLIQFFLIYFWAGITKHFGEWLLDRTALHDVLAHPDHGSSLGSRLTSLPALLEAGSVATVALEVLGTVLLFLPLAGIARRRVWLVAAFIGFHAAMALFMTLEIFPYVMMVGWLVFLPEQTWSRLFGGAPIAQLDKSRLRNAVAGVALGYVLTSSVVTWLYFPARVGVPAVIQEVGRHLVLVQQWLMFSMPSSL